jgi:hypothetical protein
VQVFLPGELRSLHPVDVNFANWLRLVHLGVESTPNSLRLCLHWRTIRRPTRPWRCFVHVLSDGRQVSSLDHRLLNDQPSVLRWEPGDDGYQTVEHWWDHSPGSMSLHLGLFDPVWNLRCPVVASTLPVVDDSSAVRIDPGREPGDRRLLRFDAPPLRPCGILFERGLELTAWSASRRDELVWLRLKWTWRGSSRRGLRFFGHAVAEPSPAAPTLAQFDQDIALERRGPATWLEQNVTSRVAAPEAVWLRAGVFEPGTLRRLAVVRAEQADSLYRCAYLPLAREAD